MLRKQTAGAHTSGAGRRKSVLVRLTVDEAELLERLAGELGCYQADVLRAGLRVIAREGAGEGELQASQRRYGGFGADPDHAVEAQRASAEARRRKRAEAVEAEAETHETDIS